MHVWRQINGDGECVPQTPTPINPFGPPRGNFPTTHINSLVIVCGNGTVNIRKTTAARRRMIVQSIELQRRIKCGLMIIGRDRLGIPAIVEPPRSRAVR